MTKKVRTKKDEKGFFIIFKGLCQKLFQTWECVFKDRRQISDLMSNEFQRIN